MGIEYPQGDLAEIGKADRSVLLYFAPSLLLTHVCMCRKYRRAVNLVGGEVVNINKVDLEKESSTDDGSGVHDFAPNEVDKYLNYPEVMLGLTKFVPFLLRHAQLSDIPFSSDMSVESSPALRK